ncbi:tRNA pseudouridine(55) synthase TruB [Candidatus Poribacteria bacterium]|nr:tRNA pseudouridine(55) synthase TruB [Candidatus Poribacteria bacterium]
MDGLLNINKPAGMTSHDVVAELRRLLKEKKIGHTGTLDPDATGVLPVCIGKSTKIIQFLEDNQKGYEGTITFGIETDTLDSSGSVTSISDSKYLTQEELEKAFRDFTGEINQIPPMVSAVKFKGKRLYEIARQGKTVKRKPRKINVYDLTLLKLYEGKAASNLAEGIYKKADFRVLCSKGTYVRSLAADIGRKLNCGAHLSCLIRTISGQFNLSNSVELEKIREKPEIASNLILTINDALSFMPAITVNNKARKRFLNGMQLRNVDINHYNDDFQDDDPVRVIDTSGTLLGIGRIINTRGFVAEPDLHNTICKAIKVLKNDT